jgi:hypothetical protein
MRTCLGQFIRAFMGRRFITETGIRGAMLRGDENFIATETTFIVIAGNAKLDNAIRGDVKVETN